MTAITQAKSIETVEKPMIQEPAESQPIAQKNSQSQSNEIDKPESGQPLISETKKVKPQQATADFYKQMLLARYKNK